MSVPTSHDVLEPVTVVDPTTVVIVPVEYGPVSRDPAYSLPPPIHRKSPSCAIGTGSVSPPPPMLVGVTSSAASTPKAAGVANSVRAPTAGRKPSHRARRAVDENTAFDLYADPPRR